MRAALAALAAGLTACTPLPVERAEALCRADARRTVAPLRGTVRTGFADGALASRVELELGTPDAAGRDPAAEFDACVLRRSGQRPSRPLYEQPGWSR
ncbi:MAG: hypothetical protein ACOY5U_13855 [Pseudomonadota bacterium]